jgi:alanyl-tRNA synthetase
MASQNKIPKTSSEIRQSFFDFFANKAHTFVRSAPVVTTDDPTLLFTNAGMNQFKPIFLGDNKDGLQRAHNSQKCIRVSGKHNDLEVVGKDTYHHTFFEMLGNWSFGDYYKKEAIAWAWELLTDVWKLPKERIYVTVFRTDDEAAALWESETDIAPERILRFDEKDNFWEMGDVGPCGPCSEIHFDRGEPETQQETYLDPILGVNGENDRYIEIWNLVFIQYQRLNSGELQPLNQKHVDTGMGFERICAILQDVRSNYDIDIFSILVQKTAQLSGTSYDPGEKGTPHRVLADHIRALSFAIADGAMPGNEGRGYVLRRILRRASRYARSIGSKEPILYKLVASLADTMGEAFPELKERQEFITSVIRSEEERFIKTLDQGLERFRKASEKITQEGSTTISGKDAFTLYDTYGFPLDLTCLLAEEKGLTVDVQGYETHMEAQHERAKQGAKFDGALTNDENWNIVSDETQSDFVGYDSHIGTGKLLRYRIEKDDNSSEETIYIVLDKTPFYPEGGGQVGDTGTLSGKTKEGLSLLLKVQDTVKHLEMILHKCTWGNPDANGPEILKDVIVLDGCIDSEKRYATEKNHSGTHLLHAALQKVLGDHVQQQGSRVDSQNLRFDFTHFKAVSPEEIEAIENEVNNAIQANFSVTPKYCSFDQAKEEGAMALFGEKYGDEVRVISMGQNSPENTPISPFSSELCGGCHVASTGNIGLLKIIGESSTAAGVRRMEAVTGKQALLYVQQIGNTLSSIGRELKAKLGKELEKVSELQEQSKQLQKEVEQLRTQQAAGLAESLLTKAKTQGPFCTLVEKLPSVSKAELSALADKVGETLQSSMKKGIVVFTNATEGQLSILVLLGADLITKPFGLKAGDLVKTISAVADGKGGGRPNRAQAGSKSPEKENLVLEKAEEVLLTTLGALKSSETNA